MGDTEKEYTIFCPSDDAMGDFAKKNGVTKIDLPTMPGLADVVKGHIVEGKFPIADLPAEVTTLAGTTIATPSAWSTSPGARSSAATSTPSTAATTSSTRSCRPK